MYAVILAGGGGTRLHPLSRPERPKPFLPLLGERSLLQGTIERLAGLTDDITVVTDHGYLIPDLTRTADVHGLAASPLIRFEEKPKPARAEELAKQEAVAWNAGIFLWRRQAI